MAGETPIINIITHRLPRELSRPIYNEFQNRFQESVRIIEKYAKYQVLKDDLDVVEVLLALSIFYNRVIVNLDAVTKFYGLVTRNEVVSAVRIGTYILNADEIHIIQSILISYQKLMRRYEIDEFLWNYTLTIEFLQRLINLKSIDDGRGN
jgi:hypothetical protein